MGRAIFVLDRILRSDKVCALWSEDLFQGRHVERRRRLNKAVGRLLRRIEFFLFYLRPAAASVLAAALNAKQELRSPK